MRAMFRRLPAWLALAAAVSLGAQAFATTKEQTLVDKARLAVDALRDDTKFSAFPGLLAAAKAVLIMPELIKIGFFFGSCAMPRAAIGANPLSTPWGRAASACRSARRSPRWYSLS